MKEYLKNIVVSALKSDSMSSCPEYHASQSVTQIAPISPRASVSHVTISTSKPPTRSGTAVTRTSSKPTERHQQVRSLSANPTESVISSRSMVSPLLLTRLYSPLKVGLARCVSESTPERFAPDKAHRSQLTTVMLLALSVVCFVVTATQRCTLPTGTLGGLTARELISTDATNLKTSDFRP